MQRKQNAENPHVMIFDSLLQPSMQATGCHFGGEASRGAPNGHMPHESATAIQVPC